MKGEGRSATQLELYSRGHTITKKEAGGGSWSERHRLRKYGLNILQNNFSSPPPPSPLMCNNRKTINLRNMENYVVLLLIAIRHGHSLLAWPVKSHQQQQTVFHMPQYRASFDFSCYHVFRNIQLLLLALLCPGVPEED